MLRNKSTVRVLLLACLIVVCVTTAAQNPASSASAAQHKGKSTQIDGPRERGLSLLKQAIAQSGSYDPASRAAIYYLAGHALGTSGSQFAKDSLEMAYRTLDQLKGDKTPGLFMLEGNIVRETALVAPSKVEEGLPQDETMRATALSALVDAYVKQKKIDHAIELVALIPDPDIYSAVHTLLDAIPATDRERRSRVFAYAIKEYGKTQHTANIVGYPDDLGSLTVHFWKTLPSRDVLNAIDVLLDESDPDKQATQGTSHNLRLTASNPKGTRVLSLYEYRLNQVIPILQSLDPTKADFLSKKRSQTLNDGASKAPVAPPAKIAIGRNDVAVSSQVVAAERNRIGESIVASAEKNPQPAVEKAEEMQDTALSARILVGIADSYASKDPQFAVSVLNRLRAKGSAVPDSALDDAIKLALKLDQDLAKEFLETKFEQAEAQYKRDSDPDHPNTAIKLYWPSTGIWRDAFRLAYKLSPPYSIDKLKSVPDPEIGSMERAMLACSFLEVPVWSDSPIGMP